MKRILAIIITLYTLQVSAQDIIQMEKTGGVYKVPCKINGLGLKFIFDTGASDVSLSLSEAVFMVKNGYLNESDFRGTETYRIANGDIAEGTKVNLRKVEFGKQTLYNVEASIVHSLDAPLLLGQSVLQRLGKFSVDYSNNTLIIGIGSVVSNKSNSNSNTNSTTSNTTGTVTDINGKVYKTVKIGDQWWMAENLDVDRFRNGDLIVEARSKEEWIKAGENGVPAWCYYNNDTVNGLKYGRIYNWYAVNDSRGLCPQGFRISNDQDWINLTEYLGGNEVAGIILKSKDGWPYNGNGTNEAGFNARPGGYRLDNSSFDVLGSSGYWWTSTPKLGFSSYGRMLYSGSNHVFSTSFSISHGLYVRCISE